MAYTLQALIGGERLIKSAEPDGTSVVTLPQGMAMVPITDQVREAYDIPYIPFTDDRKAADERVPDGLVELVSPIAKVGKVVYVEADFFGGDGMQACVMWEKGGRTLAPAPSINRWAINAALQFLGVSRADHRDEFDALDLGLHRRTEKWRGD
jgi:hypothetical protein